MVQARPNSQETLAQQRPRLARALREAALLFAGALCLYVLITLFSYSPQDVGFSSSGTGHIANLGGLAGAWIADILFSLFGYVAYTLPVLVLFAGWRAYQWGRAQPQPARPLGAGIRGGAVVVSLFSACGLAALHAGTAYLPQGSGGILGAVVEQGLVDVFSMVGATLFMLTLLVIALPIMLVFSWFSLMDRIGAWVLLAWGRLADSLGGALAARRERAEAVRIVQPEKVPDPPKPRRVKKKRADKKASSSSAQMPLPIGSGEQGLDVPKVKDGSGPVLPPMEMLDPARSASHAFSNAELERMSRDVERHLADFGVQVKVVAAQPGPVITRFELEPAPGVKVSQVSNLSKDLARALSTISVRVVEVIPGKSVIGLEIPNEERELIALRGVLENRRYGNSPSPLTLALGKDIGGEPVTTDLSRMPHLLVAGTTGSGKSVAINAMILSMLYKATAEQVRLIMIDPKMLELSVYEGIPHLLAPVVTDMKEAANALRWCVAEMERRYRLMAALGVRNLAGFNRKVEEAASRGEAIPDPLAEGEEGEEKPGLEPLPLIVVIVDELADMMMVVGKKVEELIARLAQKARAAGIHLILATQRPSVDVITGLIKANIPTRVAFQVSSRVDSRTILDQMGAESLLGHGDMLFLPPGTAMPTRVHGAFVDDHEVHKVVAFLRQLGEPDYMEEILQGEPEPAAVDAGEDAESDPLYDQAVQVVLESRKASISYVQRRLRVGYNRAARLVEQMERSGLVGPLQGNGAREVLAPAPQE